jgi:hypothetical protein
VMAPEINFANSFMTTLIIVFMWRVVSNQKAEAFIHLPDCNAGKSSV